MAVRRGTTVLLVKRGREPSRGYYAFPGGRVETGEDAEQAARRELLEETGLDVGDLAPVREYRVGGTKDGRAMHYRLMVFSGVHKGGEAVAGDDADEAGWYDLDAMRGMLLSDFVFDVAREVLSGRSR
ncbi:NUDIX hydrolase [Mesorhizobium sp. L-8-3]|uniref:NUDIX hydrolase n=1 Tax=Mesorhizobium sp. L-8-3 TaxID=2744522 RepID=UPI00313CBFC9